MGWKRRRRNPNLITYADRRLERGYKVLRAGYHVHYPPLSLESEELMGEAGPV